MPGLQCCSAFRDFVYLFELFEPLDGLLQKFQGGGRPVIRKLCLVGLTHSPALRVLGLDLAFSP